MKTLRESKWLYAILMALALIWSAPVSARFIAVDPKADQYPNLSPYVYCANNPMKFVDPDGAGIIVSEATRARSEQLWSESAAAGLAFDMVMDPSNAAMVGTISAPASKAAGGLGSLISKAIKRVLGKTDDLKGAAGALDDVVSTGKKIPNEQLKAPPTKRGNAPIGSDGKPVELHHRGQAINNPLDELTQTQHRGKGNFKKNHPNAGESASKIDRRKWGQAKKEYWKKEWDSGRFKDE